MNILLVITNINGFHEVPYSFGLSSIASYIISKKYNVKIKSIIEENDYDDLIKEIKFFKPQIVGFTSVSSQFSFVKKAANLIKRYNKDIFIVCGGIHPTLFPDAILEIPSIDGFFRGESEIAFGDFLDKFKEKEDYLNSKNFVYRKDGEVIINPLNPLIKELDILPHPLKGSLFEKYIEVHGTAPFFFVRGCPYLCSYCCNHALAKIYGTHRNIPRYRSVDSCIQEIKNASRKYKFKDIYISDDTFGLDKKWREEFCKKYRKEVNLKFMCLSRADIANEEYIRLLKETGCYRIQFGVESGNEYIRNKIMNRKISNKQITDTFNLCRKYGIEANALNIIGLPGETEAMILDTIKLNRKLKPTGGSGVTIFYPYKGTSLGDYCFSEGIVDEKKYSDFSNENRDSVLKFTYKEREKLRKYHKNWANLVYPFSIRERIKNIRRNISLNLRKNHETTYNILRKIKRRLVSNF